MDPNVGQDRRPRTGISVQTLIIASLASAAASYAVARIWGPGTLFGAAAAPVIVALVSETLRRPMRTVTATAKRIPTAHILPVGHEPDAPPSADPVDLQHPNPVTVTRRPADTAATPLAAVSEAPPGSGPTARGDTTMWRPRWWLAVVTGLVAFAIVIGVYTVPDLLAGRSITGNGQPTTFFGGSSSAKKKRGPTTIVKPTTSTTITKTAPRTPTTTKTTSRTATSTTTSITPTTTSLTTTTAPPTSTAPATVTKTVTPSNPVP